MVETAKNASFIQALAHEIHDINGHDVVNITSLRLVDNLQDIGPYGMVTDDIAMGHPEGIPSPIRFLAQQDESLLFTPDDTLSGTNWVSFETRFTLRKKNCVLALRIEGSVDRVVYPDIFVRNNFSGATFYPSKVAVLSPKDGNTMLLINLAKSTADEPHTLTILFNKGGFTFRVDGISYVSL